MSNSISNFLSSAIGRLGRNMALATNPAGIISNTFAPNSNLTKFLNPGDTLLQRKAAGEPITTNAILDPGGFFKTTPPPAPTPPPMFPDTAGAEANARNRIRRRAVSSGLGSTILTGNYSATGQASPILGG